MEEKAQSFYSDMSEPSLQLPFDLMQKWLNKRNCTLDYKNYDDKFAWCKDVRELGYRLIFFGDEVHHVYELIDKELSRQIIYQLYVIGKSTCSLGYISSSSYKLKYAFCDIPDYPNLNNTVYKKKPIYPLREADKIAKYCNVSLDAATTILWHTGGVPRYMNTPNDLPISHTDYYINIDKNPVLASLLTLFYLKYVPSNPLAIITLKWTELFTNQCLSSEFAACIDAYSESYFFHASGAKEIQLLLPYTISFIVEYFKLSSGYLDQLVFTWLTEKTFTSMGHFMESVILSKHSDDLELGEYNGVMGSELVDGVYQVTGASDAVGNRF